MTLELTQSVLVPSRPEVTGDASLILIYGGAELGKRYQLRNDVTVGRDSTNEICVDQSFVSRQHARFMRRGDQWYIKDLGSRNGTQLNGETIGDEKHLDNGDQIKIGGSIFKFIAGGNVEALFHEEIYRMTIFDGLTKVHNKRYMLEFTDREIARARRYQRPLSLAMLDIDFFKKINDTHGHQAGDYVLEKVAQTIARLMRQEQLIARYGGEEFSMILPEVDGDQLLQTCEAVRRAVEAEKIEFSGTDIQVTVSIGAAMLSESGTRDELIKLADEQLYEAKRSGRNRVMIAS